MSNRVIRRLAGVFFAGLMAVAAVSVTQVDQTEGNTQDEQAKSSTLGWGTWD